MMEKLNDLSENVYPVTYFNLYKDLLILSIVLISLCM